jgi:ribonuclease P protein component
VPDLPTKAAAGSSGLSQRRFEVVFKEGGRVIGEYARAAFLPGSGLIGFATSKKIGSKPQRNRARRRYREALRANWDRINSQLDAVVIISPKAVDATFPQLRSDAAVLLDRIQARWVAESECS